jgi:hypothetical protein
VKQIGITIPRMFSGGFEPELAADGFFDLFARAAIILHQLVNRFSGFVTLRYNRRGNSGEPMGSGFDLLTISNLVTESSLRSPAL